MRLVAHNYSHSTRALPPTIDTHPADSTPKDLPHVSDTRYLRYVGSSPSIMRSLA